MFGVPHTSIHTNHTQYTYITHYSLQIHPMQAHISPCLEEDVAVAHDGDHGARAGVERRRAHLGRAVPTWVGFVRFGVCWLTV